MNHASKLKMLIRRIAPHYFDNHVVNSKDMCQALKKKNENRTKCVEIKQHAIPRKKNVCLSLSKLHFSAKTTVYDAKFVLLIIFRLYHTESS